MQQMRMECDEMTAPTPEGIIMWHAAIEAAAGLFHDEQMTIWSSEIMADMALDAGVQPADYDGVVDCYRAIRETLTEIGNAIRALPPPGDLRAALAALVKPLVWETDPRWTGTEWGVPTFDGQYQINDQCDGSWLLTKPNGDDILTDTLEAARAAAEEDHRRRVVAAIMGDEG